MCEDDRNLSKSGAEITPEMIAAGVAVSYDLVRTDGLEVSRDALVLQVFQAMESWRPRRRRGISRN